MQTLMRGVADRKCGFDFEVEPKDGADSYVVTVGDRGEQAYSWEELAFDGARLGVRG